MKTAATATWIHTIRLSDADINVLERVKDETGLVRRIDALRYLIRDYARRRMRSSGSTRR